MSRKQPPVTRRLEEFTRQVTYELSDARIDAQDAAEQTGEVYDLRAASLREHAVKEWAARATEAWDGLTSQERTFLMRAVPRSIRQGRGALLDPGSLAMGPLVKLGLLRYVQRGILYVALNLSSETPT